MHAFKAVRLAAGASALVVACAYGQSPDSAAVHPASTTATKTPSHTPSKKKKPAAAHADSTKAHAGTASAHGDSTHAGAATTPHDSTRARRAMPGLDERLAHWIAATGGADSATVMRLEAVPRASHDSVDVDHAEWETRIASTARVGHLWIERFSRSMGPPSKYSPDQECRPQADPRAGDQLIVGVHFDTKGQAPSALLMFKERCVQLRDGDHASGSVRGGPGNKSILLLLREAFPHDEVVQQVTAPFLAAVQSPEPGVVVTRPSTDSLPKFGDYVYVEELPEATTTVAPQYPETARAQGASGTVMVQALVGKDGLVKDTQIVNSIPLLDQAAVDTVRQWRFRPATNKGNPVAVWVAVPVKFSLDGAPSAPRDPQPAPPTPPDTTARAAPPDSTHP